MRMVIAEWIAPGPQRRRLMQGVYAAGMLGVFGLAAAIPLIVVIDTQSRRRSERIEWTIDGPPCPSVERPGPGLLGRRPLKTFTYGDITFGRRTGHVSCAAFDEGGLFDQRLTRVCQFTSPGLLAVTSGGQTRYFTPGFGQKATINAAAGRAPRCVLAGWFSL